MRLLPSSKARRAHDGPATGLFPCLGVRQTRGAVDIISLNCKAGLILKNKKHSKNALVFVLKSWSLDSRDAGAVECKKYLSIREIFAICSSLCLQREEGTLLFQVIV